MSILGPLRGIRAETIEVELDSYVPEDVWRALGPVDFEVVFREREFNEGFRGYPMFADCVRVKERRGPACSKRSMGAPSHFFSASAFSLASTHGIKD